MRSVLGSLLKNNIKNQCPIVKLSSALDIRFDIDKNADGYNFESDNKKKLRCDLRSELITKALQIPWVKGFENSSSASNPFYSL